MSTTSRIESINLRLIFVLSVINGCLSVCEFDIKVRQELELNGYHRNMTYMVTFGPTLPDTIELNDCLLGIYQPLPSGIYANPDELNELRRAHKLNAVTRKMNIELPADQAEPSNVYLTAKIMGTQVATWLPIHARYHKAEKYGGYAINEIDAPYIYLRCPDGKLDYCTNLRPAKFICATKDKCDWRTVSFAMATLTPIEWQVPIGDHEHYYLVASGTALVVAIGSLYLMYTLHDYKTTHH